MAFCPNCGTPNTDQTEKCVACGFELIVPKQKAKFKGTIMMSGIKAPASGETPVSTTEPPPTEPAPEPAVAPPSAAPKLPEPGRNPNYAKTMMGHAAILVPPPTPTEPIAQPAVESPSIEFAGGDTEPPPDAAQASSRSPASPAAPANAAPGVVAQDPPRSAAASRDSLPSRETSANPSWTGSGSPRSPSRTGIGGYDSTVPPSAPPAPKPGKVIAIGCAAALALFCVVGSIIYYVVGAKVRSMMGSDDSAAETAAWQASIVQSLAQVSELCKSDCAQAGVYFHPLKEAALLSEARALTPERLQKLSDSTQTEATMLNGTDDEAAATKLGLDPQQCARVSKGSAKVISCSVPDPTGKPSVLRIVELAGLSSL
ncbi:MAG: DnaJ-class molecular chaperone CbpA [Myxococcaceae bacterium]|nr:DnaJ-class molecular chaperone CbpA [Myxococcaceae bacterium]